MEKGINILDHKYLQLRSWLGFISDKRGINSTLTIGQICDMLDSLDGAEKRTDKLILTAFGVGEE